MELELQHVTHEIPAQEIQEVLLVCHASNAMKARTHPTPKMITALNVVVFTCTSQGVPRKDLIRSGKHYDQV